MTNEELASLPADFSKLSPTVAMAIGNMSAGQRDVFDHEYRRAKRSTVVMVLLAVLFPIQFFLLDKTGLGVIYWLTFGFLGIGWVVFWFVTPSMVKEYNEQKANEIIRNIRYAAG
ncbi:MAG: TM2 domain-containing protein [bacterium]|nr:TM2 domain-containing protein [bacterium]